MLMDGTTLLWLPRTSGHLSLLPLPNTRSIFLIGRSLEATALAYRFKSNSLNCYHSAQAGIVTRLAMANRAHRSYSHFNGTFGGPGDKLQLWLQTKKAGPVRIISHNRTNWNDVRGIITTYCCHCILVSVAPEALNHGPPLLVPTVSEWNYGTIYPSVSLYWHIL